MELGYLRQLFALFVFSVSRCHLGPLLSTLVSVTSFPFMGSHVYSVSGFVWSVRYPVESVPSLDDFLLFLVPVEISLPHHPFC